MRCPGERDVPARPAADVTEQPERGHGCACDAIGTDVEWLLAEAAVDLPASEPPEELVRLAAQWRSGAVAAQLCSERAGPAERCIEGDQHLAGSGQPCTRGFRRRLCFGADTAEGDTHHLTIQLAECQPGLLRVGGTVNPKQCDHAHPFLAPEKGLLACQPSIGR